MISRSKIVVLIVVLILMVGIEYLVPVEAVIKRPPGEKVLVLTFDDGTIGQYVNAYPILEKYGIKATFGIITGSVGDPKHLTWPMIEEMHLGGQDFISHTVDHFDLSQVYNPFLMAYELAASKNDLSAHGINTDILMLPYGAGFYNPVFRLEIERYYNYSLTIYGVGYPDLASLTLNGSFDRLNIPRIGIYNSTSLEFFKSLIDNFTLKNQVIILAFHLIDYNNSDLRPARFDAEMKYLKDNGVRTETLTEFLGGH